MIPTKSIKMHASEADWGVIADDFVYKRNEDGRLNCFVQTLHRSKIQSERYMRAALDQRIVSGTYSELLKKELGYDLMQRISALIKGLRSEQDKVNVQLFKSKTQPNLNKLLTTKQATLKPRKTSMSYNWRGLKKFRHGLSTQITEEYSRKIEESERMLTENHDIEIEQQKYRSKFQKKLMVLRRQISEIEHRTPLL